MADDWIVWNAICWKASALSRARVRSSRNVGGSSSDADDDEEKVRRGNDLKWGHHPFEPRVCAKQNNVLYLVIAQ
jgi:hypothetical protein